MKKIFLTLLEVVLLAPSLKGQTTKNISLTFNLGEFQTQVVSNHLYISSDTLDVWYGNNTSEPALPYVRVNVLIPPDKEYSNFSFTYSRQLVSTQIPVASNPAMVPSGSPTPLQPPEIIIPIKLFYPDSNVVYDGTCYNGIYKILSFKVYPFSIYTLGNSLYLYTNINMQITLTETEDILYPDHYVVADRREELMSLTRESVVNGAELDSMYANISYPAFSPQMQADSIDYGYDYLIISPNYTIFPAIDQLARWKTMKGVRTKVLNIDSIYAQYDSNVYTPQMMIKNTIKEYFLKSGERLKYVLLAGDVDKIPTLMCHGEVDQKNDTTIALIPTDYYYSCLEDIDWDRNGNGIYGELEDSISIFPNVAISRIPLNRYAATDYVSRLLNYEQSPDTSNWQNKILMCGVESIGRIPIDNTGFNYISDAHYKLDRLYNIGIKDYWDGERVRYYDDYTDFPDGASFDVNSYNLSSVLSDNYSIMAEFSHGDTIAWILENSYWETANVYGGFLPMVVTAACLTNAFDASVKCLGETFLDKMSLAYIGSSRTAWGKAYFDTAIDDCMQLFFRHFFQNNGQHVGEIFKIAKYKHSLYGGNYEDMRWNIFNFNILGDTEFSIYVEKPHPLNNVTINYYNNELHVYTGEDSCNVCVTSYKGNDVEYFELRNNTNHAVFNNLHDNYYVCVTKQGRIPYVKEISINNYIQNVTNTSNVTIQSYNNTYIGSHVTNDKPEGPVIIQSGKTIIENGNNVFLHGEFEVKPGAEFEIR